MYLPDGARQRGQGLSFSFLRWPLLITLRSCRPSAAPSTWAATYPSREILVRNSDTDFTVPDFASSNARSSAVLF